MKKVITPGKKIFETHCEFCGCHFSYELLDIEKHTAISYVTCPNCYQKCVHKLQDIHEETAEITACNHEFVVKDVTTSGVRFVCRKCGYTIYQDYMTVRNTTDPITGRIV